MVRLLNIDKNIVFFKLSCHFTYSVCACSNSYSVITASPPKPTTWLYTSGAVCCTTTLVYSISLLSFINHWTNGFCQINGKNDFIWKPRRSKALQVWQHKFSILFLISHFYLESGIPGHLDDSAALRKYNVYVISVGFIRIRPITFARTVLFNIGLYSSIA